MIKRTVLALITNVVSDNTGRYKIGEIDGFFEKDALNDYFLLHGEKGQTELINHLANLQSQVVVGWKLKKAVDTIIACDYKKEI